jgi:hypothetical protein
MVMGAYGFGATMGSSKQIRALCAMVCLALAGIARTSAAGEELTPSEIRALSSGQLVVREDDTERNGRRYIGGVSYIVIGARPREVTTMLDDVRTYRDILPRTRSVRWLGLARTGESILELEQGTSLVHGRYAIRVRRDRGTDDGAVIRFWLDPSFRHDIADAGGFFRVEPFGDKTLLTYLVMVDLGDGIVVRLFEGRVRRAALSTPALVKAYVESHRPPS